MWESPGNNINRPVSNLPQKIDLLAFLCFNLEFIPFSAKIQILLFIVCYWGIFACTRTSSLTKIISIAIIKGNLDGLCLM